MDDKNKTIFESVPVEEPTQQPTQPVQPNQQQEPTMVPEEVAPEVESPASDQAISMDGGMPPDMPPPMAEENKMKYIIIAMGAVFFVLVLIFIFTFFTGKKKPSKAITLTYWGLWEEKEIFEPLIAEYQKKNPNIKIDYQKMTAQDSYREKILKRSENGTGPDIFRFHNTWVPEITQVLAALPSNIMSNDEFEKTFYSIHQKDLKCGNAYCGLPLEIDGLVLIYNESLLKQAGVFQAPLTWDNITDAVVKTTVKDINGSITTAGIAIGTASNISFFSDILGLMIVQNGVDLKNLDKKEAADALEAFRKFAEPPLSQWNEQMPDSTTAFVQEKVAMIIAPSWVVLNIKQANPEIKIKVVPVPYVPGTNSVSLANYWIEGVSLKSKNQPEAWKFLRFLVEKDNMTKLYEAQSKERLFGEPYSRVDLGSLIIQNEYIGPVIKQAQATDGFVTMPVVGRTYDNGLNDEIVTYLENAVNATIQGISYQEAMNTAKKGIDEVMKRYEK